MSPEAILYSELRKKLEAIDGVKYVRLFNNQFERSNGEGHDGRKENIPVYPCVLIQIQPSEFSDGSSGWQSVDYSIRLHLATWSQLDEDLTFLNLKWEVYKAIQKWKPSGGWNSLLRINEEPNFDHDNVNEYVIEFKTNYSDFSAQNIGVYKKINITLNDTATIISPTQSTY